MGAKTNRAGRDPDARARRRCRASRRRAGRRPGGRRGPGAGMHSSPSTSSPTTRTFASGTGASSPQSSSKASPYRRRALASSLVGSTTCGAPISETWTISAGVLPHERPGGARVVEVDVGEEEVTQVADLDAAGRERLAQRREAARRAAVEEREPVVRLDQVRGDPAGVARSAGGRAARPSRGRYPPMSFGVPRGRRGYHDDVHAKGGTHAYPNPRRRSPVLDRPVQLRHREGDRVLRHGVRLGRPVAAGGLRRLLHVHEGRQARRRLHGQRR